jgi:hypothetical protein
MSQLIWPDLIIDNVSPDQFRDWLAPWSRAITGRVALAFLSKFGSWFLRRPEGQVEMFDVLTGELIRVADTYDAFISEVNEQWWQETYLFSELVYRLHQAGKVPGPEQCYALAPHPALGGPNPNNNDSIEPEFVMVMDVIVWQRLCAQVLGVGQ